MPNDNLPPMKSYAPTPEHEVTYKDLIALCNKHPSLSSEEILAIACNMVGKLVALQDQRHFTPEMVMEIVAQNIQRGNAQAVLELASVTGLKN